MIEKLGLALLHRFDPETAHSLALKALATGLAGGSGPVTSARLATSIAGIDLPNPIGAAAGFDKNAVAADRLMRTGFGFCEIGAVTPLPQAGNDKPRLFRLNRDRAAINRFGFNNAGQDVIRANLAAHRPTGIVGVNLGANKETTDKADDYCSVLKAFHDLIDFATVNVSSPNTEKLRDLQGRAALDALLIRVIEQRDALPRRVPVFLKIAPDLDEAEIADIAEVAQARRIDAVVATNTTLARDGLLSKHASEAGGLSGAPLFQRSTEVLRTLHRHLQGAVPLIGAGGVATAEQALTKIRAGASAVQLYTAMVFEGVSLGGRIAIDLDRLLAANGFANVADVVGTED